MQNRTISSEKNLSLEVGKTYRNRNDNIVKIIDYCLGDSPFCFYDEFGNTYNEYGWFYSYNATEELFDERGLIEEVPEAKFEITEEILIDFVTEFATHFDFSKDEIKDEWDEFKQKLTVKSSDEYKEYLRLKDKYSNFDSKGK